MHRSESESIDSGTSASLVEAVTRVLRPLVGLLIQNRLTYPWLAALLKGVFVGVADKDFRLAHKAQTDSRITLLTGVHRKDVRRLRQAGMENDNVPDNVFLGAHLVAIWTSDERFLDADGHPLPLPRRARTGGPDFKELVTSVNKDIRPRVVLDEWLRLGAVELDEDGCVRLKTDAFVPSTGFEEKIYYLGRNVADHLAAARYNVEGGDPPMLERSVYYDELTAESVRELDEMARREGMRTLQLLNRRAHELQVADRDARGADHRIKVGVYVYYEREKDDAEDGE